MLLSLYVVLNAVGFVAWIVGAVFRQPEVAVIGGVISAGCGTVVVATGLEYQSGSVRDIATTNENNTTVTDSVTVSRQYTEASLPQQYGVGILTVLLGSSGVFRGLDALNDI